jgi:Fic family protein
MTLPYFHIDTRNERLKTLAGKHASLWSEFNEKLDISWIYHDHGLEGVVLQPQEISMALNAKPNTDTANLAMYDEVTNMREAIAYTREQLTKKKSERITKNLLQQCYQLVTQNVRGVPEGDGIRQEDGRYGAYYHKSCPFTEIEVQLKKVLSEANQTTDEDLHPIVQATRFHYQIMNVMPYGRFSGKISRLIANLILMRNNYPPVVLHTVERARYYEALADEDETQLLQLVVEGLTNTVESAMLYIEEGLAERRRKREARKLVKEQAEKKAAAKTTKAKTTKAKTTKAKTTKAKTTKAKTTKAKTTKAKTTKAKPTKSTKKTTTKKTTTGARQSAKKATKTTKTTKTASRKSTKSKTS